MTPKFFFLSLGVIVTLIASVTAFLNLVFEVLNHKFPDALNSVYQYGYNSYNFDSARSALATLIILFPVFLVISYFWTKTVQKGIGHVDTIIRKWMLYLVIFLSAVVTAVDLVTLVRYFVSGEITSRFIYKIVITLLIALGIGMYYIFELQEKKKIWGINIGVSSVIKASVVVIALVVWSFSVIGSPKDQRMWRLDDKRVQDLQSIQWQVINFWQQKEKLPVDLKELNNPIAGSSVPVDPEFEQGRTYEYKATGQMSFELCATFSAVMPKGWQENSYGGSVMPMTNYAQDSVTSTYPYPGGGVNDSWDHQAGHTCFTRTIDKDLYPPYPKPEAVKAL